METKLIGIAELSQVLGVSVSTLYRWRKNRQLPSVKLGGRVRFRATEIDRWIERREVKVQ